MQKNDFKIVPKKEKKGFSRNLIILFLVCLLLLLPFAIRSFVFLIGEFSYMTWKYSVSLFLKDVVLELTFVILFLVVYFNQCSGCVPKSRTSVCRKSWLRRVPSGSLWIPSSRA